MPFWFAHLIHSYRNLKREGVKGSVVVAVVVGGGRGGRGGRERKTGQREMCVPSGPKVLKKIVK